MHYQAITKTTQVNYHVLDTQRTPLLPTGLPINNQASTTATQGCFVRGAIDGTKSKLLISRHQMLCDCHVFSVFTVVVSVPQHTSAFLGRDKHLPLFFAGVVNLLIRVIVGVFRA